MQPSSHPHATREIRVFLSSTFRDMEHEREYLMTRVFPRFRKLCLQREVVFTEIDLRWGITQEAANNGRTVQICLEEIDRCRSLQLPPFFIGFLAERYGWIPTHADMKHYWEQAPHAAYAQEIQQALAQGISVTELEIRFGFLDEAPSEAASRVLMLLRDPALTAQMADISSADDFYELQQQEPLQQLKAALRQAKDEGQTALVDGYGSLETFGDAIHAFLVAQLDTLFPAQEVPDALMQRRQLHDGYAASRLRSYVPLEERTHQLWELLTMPDAPVCVMVQGPSGSGKSAFVAHFAQNLYRQHSVQVLQHFLAAEETPRLTLWRDRLLQTLLAQGWVNHPLPETEYQRWQALPAWLGEAAEHLGQRILLVLDALDQATDAAVALPVMAELPWGPAVRLLTTATPTIQAPDLWRVFPVLPLDAQERGLFVHTYLNHFAKQLPDALLQRLVSAPACDTPLFLKTVLEEARVRSKHASLEQDMQRWLAHPDTASLFMDALAALDQQYASHAPALASRAARYMAAAMHGLTQNTLAEMLAPAGQLRLPDQLLLPLLANLQAYVQQNQGRLRLQHALLTDAIEQDRSALKQSRQELLAHHQDDDDRSLAEAAYQTVRLQLTADEDTVRMGFMDADSPMRTFEDYLRYDYEQKTQLLETMKDLPAFIRVWQLDSNISYNYLQLLGAGKAWQQTDHQEFLLAYWMESLQALDTASLLKLPLDDLTLWFDQKAMVHLCRAYAIHLMQFKQKHLADQPQELAVSATVAAQMLLEHGSRSTPEYVQIQQWLDLAQQAWKQVIPDANTTTPEHCPGQMSTLLQQAALHYRQDQYPQALERIHQALALQQSLEAAAFPTRTCALWDLRALIHARLGDFDRAVADADYSRRVRVQLHGPVHRNVAQSLNLLGHIRALEEDYEQAQIYLHQCAVMTRQTELELHLHLGRVLHRLATVHEQLGQLDAAEALYEEALDCWQQHLPPGDARRNATCEQLAMLHQKCEATDAEKSVLESLLMHCSLPLHGDWPAPEETVLTRARTHLRLAQIHAQQDEGRQAQKHWMQGLQQLRSHSLDTAAQPLVTRTREVLGALARVSFAPQAYSSIRLVEVYQNIHASLLNPSVTAHER